MCAFRCVRVATITTRTRWVLRASYKGARFSSEFRLAHFTFIARNSAGLLCFLSSLLLSLRLPLVLASSALLSSRPLFCSRLVLCSVLVSSFALFSSRLLLCSRLVFCSALVSSFVSLSSLPALCLSLVACNHNNKKKFMFHKPNRLTAAPNSCLCSLLNC